MVSQCQRRESGDRVWLEFEGQINESYERTLRWQGTLLSWPSSWPSDASRETPGPGLISE